MILMIIIDYNDYNFKNLIIMQRSVGFWPSIVGHADRVNVPPAMLCASFLKCCDILTCIWIKLFLV